MAEIFKNSVSRAVGVVTTYGSLYVGAGSTIISNLSSTAGINVGDIVENLYYIGGTKVTSIGVTFVTTDQESTNGANVSNQVVRFLGVTTAYTAPNDLKAILIGGTFANNTKNQVNMTIELVDTSSGITASLASNIPVPSGSSFILSDAGKTVLEPTDSLTVYCDANNGLDISLSILEGVN